MIKYIVAVDEKNGMANDEGIPWHLPEDVRYFRDQTKGSIVLMGFNTYLEFKSPLPDRQNLVVSRDDRPLREGFSPVVDVDKLIAETDKDIWVIGGAKLFSSLLYKVDELYITKLEGDFNCTKFFIDYSKDFELVSESEPKEDNGIRFRFTLYRRKAQ